ncbi:MAG: flagellin lysine-N-methylase [Chitinispirillia bacterium]|nr:flagellin lysine-N-methylase [Chitinispirillia bacterium]MCL2242770.1 flagellin lysine-N-methylase [Chitinispirillia bacterium]
MPKNKRSILQPTYLSSFTCIAGACEDSCCTGTWNIYVDKKTFLKYRDVGNAGLQGLLDQTVKRNRGEDASEAQYGKFTLRGACALQSADGLCRLQAELGPGLLCDTCAIYPRSYKIAGGRLECAATPSCPHIARAALSDPNGIAFETVEESAATGRIPAQAPSIDPAAQRYAAKPARFFWDIRIFCLTLLQNRAFTLAQRLIVLGMFCRKIDELDREGRTDEIPALLEKLGAGLEDESFRHGLEDVSGNFEIQMRLAKELTDKRLEADLYGSRAYLEIVAETFVGLGFVQGATTAQIMQKFNENRETYVAQYLKDKEYILENFIVNEFFLRLMPFGQGDTTWDSCAFLCVMYGMLKLHINGIAGRRKGLNDETLFALIQAFAKVVMHNAKFIPNMVRALKDNGFDTLAWMTILVSD